MEARFDIETAGRLGNLATQLEIVCLEFSYLDISVLEI